jgi:hypothetical protein
MDIFDFTALACEEYSKELITFFENKTEVELINLLNDYETLGPNSQDVNKIMDTLSFFAKLCCFENAEENNRKRLKFGLIIYYKILKNTSFNDEIRPNKLSDDEKYQLLNEANSLMNENLESKKKCNDIAELIKSVLHPETLILNIDWVNQLSDFCKSESRSVCLYPSSNRDNKHFSFFENYGNNILSKTNIFIHVDFWDCSPDVINSPQYNIAELELPTIFREDSKVFILKIEHKEKKEVNWLVHFSRTQNEEILIKLIRKPFKIDYLISKCDGITPGSGCGYGLGISTILYICFADIIDLKAIITEHSITYFHGFYPSDINIELAINNFKDWVQINLSQEENQQILDRIEGLNIVEIINEYGEEIHHECLQIMNDNDLIREFVLIKIRR